MPFATTATESEAFAILAPPGGTFWLPPEGSSLAPLVDRAFYFVFAVSAFLFLLGLALLVVFVWRYRRRTPGQRAAASPDHNTPLEIVWTVIPLALVGVMFYYGFTAYLELRVNPENAYDIRVVGQKWVWTFAYPGGYEDKDLHVPMGEPVRLTMESRDVIHSLWVPAFRVKMDLVPGRYTSTWFTATREGVFDLSCTEYCGTSHSDMVAKVVVHPPGEFGTWLAAETEKAEQMNPVDLGRKIYQTRCSVCHSIEPGVTVRGPTLFGIYGETHRFTDGSEAKVDDNYLRESIENPSAKIREGFTDQMSSFKGVLRDRQITGLIEFIQSLRQERK
jgi:cytochrome c oxidase subunit 2